MWFFKKFVKPEKSPKNLYVCVENPKNHIILSCTVPLTVQVFKTEFCNGKKKHTQKKPVLDYKCNDPVLTCDCNCLLTQIFFPLSLRD